MTASSETKLSFFCHGRESGPLYPRDGARAWLVCFCAVLYNIVVFGITKVFGVLYPVLLDEFHQGKVKTAWVGSLIISMSYCLTVVAAKLIKRFGTRSVGIAGGAIAALGCLATSFVNSIEFMYFTYSLLIGLGASFCYLSNIDIVRKYFKRRLGLATGFSLAGIGASYMVLGPIIEVLVTNVGWRNAFRVMAGMALIGSACAMSFSPHVEKDPEPQTRRSAVVQGSGKSLARNKRFLACCLVAFLFYFGVIISIVHFGRYAQESGCSLSQVATLYVGFGVCSITGRIAIGRLLDLNKFRLPHLLAIITFVTAISNFLCPFARTFATLMAFNCCIGLCDGCFATVIILLIPSNTIPSLRPQAFSLYLLTVGLSCAISPPIAGFIAETAGSYIPVFNTAGSIVLLGAAISLVIDCFKQQTGTEVILVCEAVDEEMIVTEIITVL